MKIEERRRLQTRYALQVLRSPGAHPLLVPRAREIVTRTVAWIDADLRGRRVPSLWEIHRRPRPDRQFTDDEILYWLHELAVFRGACRDDPPAIWLTAVEHALIIDRAIELRRPAGEQKLGHIRMPATDTDDEKRKPLEHAALAAQLDLLLQWGRWPGPVDIAYTALGAYHAFVASRSPVVGHRNWRLVEHSALGWSLGRIAKKFGLRKQTVSEILDAVANAAGRFFCSPTMLASGSRKIIIRPKTPIWKSIAILKARFDYALSQDAPLWGGPVFLKPTNEKPTCYIDTRGPPLRTPLLIHIISPPFEGWANPGFVA